MNDALDTNDMAVFMCRPVDPFAIPAEYRKGLRQRLSTDIIETCNYCPTTILVSEQARKARDIAHRRWQEGGMKHEPITACWQCAIQGLRVPGAVREAAHKTFHLNPEHTEYVENPESGYLQVEHGDGVMRMVTNPEPDDPPTGMYL